MREVAEDLGVRPFPRHVNLFHPEIIILGGGLSNIGEPLRAAGAEALRGWVMEVYAPGPKICLAGLAEDAVPVGALELAISAQTT